MSWNTTTTALKRKVSEFEMMLRVKRAKLRSCRVPFCHPPSANMLSMPQAPHYKYAPPLHVWKCLPRGSHQAREVCSPSDHSQGR